MSQMIDTAARLLAYARGRAQLIRQSSALAADPQPAFGIAPIRMVAEQVVYAIAYGDMESPPDVVLTWNPQDREAGFLQPFAYALGVYLRDCVDQGVLPRVWLPHPAALEVIELLGHRYRTNRNASPELQLMGAQCRLLVEEARFAGQQLVAVASDLLATHVVTGQSPSEDRHLGALLAWITPPPGVPAPEAAQQAAFEPAAAMLERAIDDQVEQLRASVREGRRAEAVVRREVERLIESEARREWALLVRARRAFWGLGLTQGIELARLVAESRSRVFWQIDRSIGAPSQARTLASRLDNLTYAQELDEYATVADDAVARERAKQAGRVIEATVVRRVQPRPKFRPCTVTIVTPQTVLRVRRGTAIQLQGTGIAGRVTEVREVDGGQATELDIDITEGVRSVGNLGSGAEGTWSEPLPVDLRRKRREVYGRMAERQDPRVYGDRLPDPAPLAGDEDLAAIARRLRR